MGLCWQRQCLSLQPCCRQPTRRCQSTQWKRSAAFALHKDIYFQGDEALDTGAKTDRVLLATAVSLFPDPLQTANSEMLFNTMDPLSSINSTMNIHDTFEEGQVHFPCTSIWCCADIFLPEHSTRSEISAS